MQRVNFLGLPLDLFDLSMIDDIKPGTKIFSLNAEQIVLIYENPEYKRILQDFDLVIPDGSGVVLGMKFILGKNTQIKKVAGVDLAKKFLEIKKRVAILGSTDEVIKKMRAKYPNNVVFAHSGYFSAEKEKQIVDQIVDSSPEILLVAMGAPKQEKFIFKYQKEFKKFICMGVGGALDTLSGKTFRAPKIFIALHLEWLWRLILEPFRASRILIRVPKFLFLLLRYKCKRV